MVQLSHPYMATGKTINLTIWTFVSKVMSLFFNTPSRFVIVLLPRSKCLNFMAAVTICSDFGAQKNKVCHCFHCFPIYLLWSDGTRCHDLSFWKLSFKPAFSCFSFTYIKRLFCSSLLSAMGFPGISVGKESACSVEDPSLILWSGRSAGEGNSYPLQYSGLENSMVYSMGSQKAGHGWVTFTFSLRHSSSFSLICIIIWLITSISPVKL